MKFSTAFSLIFLGLTAQNAFVAADQGREARECEVIDCVDTPLANDLIELTCGGSGEKIASIEFASYGTPVGDNFAGPLCSQQNYTVDPGCDAEGLKELVEKLCKGEAECEIDPVEIAKLSGVGSCVATKRLVVQVNCEEVVDVFTMLAIGVVFTIGLALGAGLKLEDFRTVVNDNKKGVAIGFASQFGFMPLIAFFMAKVFNFNDLVAIGMILTGSAPGGTTSNLLTYYSKGNVALSIAMSFASTLASFVMLPLLIIIYIETSFTESVSIPFDKVALTLVLVLIPTMIGIFINHHSENIAKKVEKFGTIFGAIFLILAFLVGTLENIDIFNLKKFPYTWLCGFLFQPLGTSFGYGLSYILGMDGPSKRAIAMETGVQNYTLVIALVAISFSGCERKSCMTLVLCCTFWYAIHSFFVTCLFRFYLAPKDEPTEESKQIETA